MDMTFLCLPFSKSRKKALSSGSSLMEVVRRLWSLPITQTIYGSYSFILCGITTIAVDLTLLSMPPIRTHSARRLSRYFFGW
jgi:hypothetical protein